MGVPLVTLFHCIVRCLSTPKHGTNGFISSVDRSKRAFLYRQIGVTWRHRHPRSAPSYLIGRDCRANAFSQRVKRNILIQPHSLTPASCSLLCPSYEQGDHFCYPAFPILAIYYINGYILLNILLLFPVSQPIRTACYGYRQP